MVSRDGKRMFIANEDDAVTTVLDLDKRQVTGQVDVGVEPEGMAVSPDDRIAVTTSETTNMAHLIDTGSYAVVGNVPVGQRPRFAAFTLTGRNCGCRRRSAALCRSSIWRRRRSRRRCSSRSRVSAATRFSRSDENLPVTATAFVALGPANRVAVINVRTGNVIKYILVGQRVWHLRLTPDEQLLFTTNGVSNDVTAIDVKALKAVKSIKVGRYPWGVAIRPTP